MCWVVDVFGEDFEDKYGSHSTELLEKMVVCVLNTRFYLIDDCDAFCDEFNRNKNDINFEIGYDESFYPDGTGNWYDENEFAIKRIDD